MPIRIVVGSRNKKKIKVNIVEIVRGEKNRDKTGKSKNIVIYDEEGRLDITELAKKIENTVNEYAESKGEVTKY